jgi:hypothetical protein
MIPEPNKKPGVCYAFTDDGIELPVIDITHPAFACDVAPAELSAIIEESMYAWEAAKHTPPEVVHTLAEKSVLVRGWAESIGGYMTGMVTYLNRLGPDNLGDGYATPIDRRMAAGIMPLSFRFRLRDIARLIADALGARPDGPLHLLNIAGGPSADTWNGLILAHRENPQLLRDRAISIHVLDIDSAGPSFGARALASLLAEGAPLHGLTASFEYVPYNWADVSGLRRVLDAIGDGAVVVGSTEGGLFDYGSDQQIVANLAALRDGTPADMVMTGSVVREANTMDKRLRSTASTASAGSRPATRYLGLNAFRPLAESAGWTIERVLDSVAHHAVSLRKSS